MRGVALHPLVSMSRACCDVKRLGGLPATTPIGRKMPRLIAALVAALFMIGGLAAGPAQARSTSWDINGNFSTPQHAQGRKPIRDFPNCTALRRHYPHGVGRKHARESEGRTNFKRHNRLYRLNKEPDADGDGVACEG